MLNETYPIISNVIAHTDCHDVNLQRLYTNKKYDLRVNLVLIDMCVSFYIIKQVLESVQKYKPQIQITTDNILYEFESK